ncbi:hypothetical protein AX16_001551, partial [Volvariella volvacea WC 439]
MSPQSLSLIVKSYAASSPLQDISVPTNLTIGDVRQMVCDAYLTHKSQPIDKESIIIASDNHGSDRFRDNALQLHSLPDTFSTLYALIPLTTSPGARERREKIKADRLGKLAAIKMRAEQEKLSSTHVLMKELDTRRQKEVGDWVEKMAAMEKKMEAMQAKSDADAQRFNDKLASSDTKIKGLTNELASSNTKIKGLTDQLASSDTKIKGLTDQLASSDTKIKGLNARIDKLESNLAENKGDYDRLQSRYTELEKKEGETKRTLQDQVRKQRNVENDIRLLDLVMMRNLVDRAQEKLATIAQLPMQDVRGSFAWRTRLGDQPDSSRLESAKGLFANRDDESAKAALQLLNSSAGMLVVERHSQVRSAGDRVAHGPLSRESLEPVISRQLPEKRDEIYALVTFVCP